MPGEGVAGHSFLFSAAELQYRFQVVVYRFRCVRAGYSR
jgi:hypothetical protein